MKGLRPSRLRNRHFLQSHWRSRPLCQSPLAATQCPPTWGLKIAIVLSPYRMAVWAGLGGDSSSLLRWCEPRQLAWGVRSTPAVPPLPTMAHLSGLPLGSAGWSSWLGGRFPSSSLLPTAGLGSSQGISRELGFLHGGCFPPRAQTQMCAGLRHRRLFLI